MSGSRKPFTVTMDTPGLLESIEAKLEEPRPDCRLWTGAVDRGYGRVWVDGQAKRVHRVVWELSVGPIPEGFEIDHLCRIRSCVNPDHMELVSHAENITRATAHRERLQKRGRLARTARLKDGESGKRKKRAA